MFSNVNKNQKMSFKWNNEAVLYSCLVFYVLQCCYIFVESEAAVQRCSIEQVLGKTLKKNVPCTYFFMKLQA